MRRAGSLFVKRPAGQYVSLLEDHDPVAEPLDEVELVTGEEHGCATRRLGASTSESESTPDASNPASGSSSTMSRGLVNEGYGKLDSLWVAVGERHDPVQLSTLEAKVRELSLRFTPGRGQRDPVGSGEVGELVKKAHLGVEAALLRHIAEVQPVR